MLKNVQVFNFTFGRKSSIAFGQIKRQRVNFFAPILSYYLCTLYKSYFQGNTRCITFTLKNLKLKKFKYQISLVILSRKILKSVSNE